MKTQYLIDFLSLHWFLEKNLNHDWKFWILNFHANFGKGFD